MNNLDFNIPDATNEPIKEYTKGTPEKISLKAKLKEMKSYKYDIPIIINGEEIRTNDLGYCVMPHDHQHVLASYHKAGEKEVQMAIESLLETWKEWSHTP